MNERIVLSAGDWEMEACPKLGANVTALRYKGRDVLRPLSDDSMIESNPYIQGAPILLPANRTYLGKFSFEGKDYTLPLNEPRTNSHLHGLVHRQSFDVVSVGDRSVVLKFVNRGEAYPFDFELVAEYSIDEDGCYQSYTIKNIGEGNMPYTFCLHTTFVEPQVFTFPIKSCQEAVKDIPTGRYIPLTEQEMRYVTGSQSKGLSVCGYYLAGGHTVTADDIAYTVSENFDHWITYNAKGERGYICLEPQAGKVNGLNMDDGHIVLAPGESHVYTMKFTHID